MRGRAMHDWIFVDGGRDGRSVDVGRRCTRRPAVIDRYFVIRRLHWTPSLILRVDSD